MIFFSLQDLIANLSDGDLKIKACKSSAERTLESTAPRGCQTIQQEMDGLDCDWSEVTSRMSAVKGRLEQSLHHWVTYEEQYEDLLHWLKDQEKQVKDFPLVSTLHMKQEQLKKYKVRVSYHICDFFQAMMALT